MISRCPGLSCRTLLAELGLEKARDPDLRRFSQQLIDDHRLADQTIRALYARRSLRLPTAVDSRAKFRLACLSGLNSAEFDRAYAYAQFVIDLDTVASFEAEAQRGQDPEVKTYAARFLPKLQEHLKTIRSIVAKGEKVEPK